MLHWCYTLLTPDVILPALITLKYTEASPFNKVRDSLLVVSAGLAVAGLAQAQVGVAAPVMSQPGIATPTVYSISNTQPSLAQQQYTQQQVALAGVQVLFC